MRKKTQTWWKILEAVIMIDKKNNKISGGKSQSFHVHCALLSSENLHLQSWSPANSWCMQVTLALLAPFVTNKLYSKITSLDCEILTNSTLETVVVWCERWKNVTAFTYVWYVTHVCNFSVQCCGSCIIWSLRWNWLWLLVQKSPPERASDQRSKVGLTCCIVCYLLLSFLLCFHTCCVHRSLGRL